MLRSVLAVVSAPIVYGLICVPTNWLVVTLFPSHFDENWMTKHNGLLVVLVTLTMVFAGASGFVGAAIAREKVMHHAIVICIVQLAIGIAVQLQVWDAMPLWYHLSFFALLLVGITVGTWLQTHLIK